MTSESLDRVLRRFHGWAVIFAFLVAAAIARSEVLTVGAGQQFETIEAANAAARPGDTIEVYPAAGDGIYRQPAIYVTKPGLRFVGKGPRLERGVDAPTLTPKVIADFTPIILDGDGFEYSGVGSTPRAIFQINRGADDGVIENFELRHAENASNNGAGIRINQANRVTIRRCMIHDNQMGIMSNGAAGDPEAAADQIIEFCIIYANGEPNHPGFNHNLYLGGTSVTMRFCEVHGSLTGHNVKSRAHFNLFYCNHVHDSANREFDLVDAWDTARANSHTVLIGNLIEKRNPMGGNTNVIHFGADGGGDHDGTLYLFNNTIITPHFGPVIQLTTRSASAHLINNIIFNDVQNAPKLYDLVGLSPEVISGDHNWLSRGYDAGATILDASTTWRGEARESTPGFVNRAEKDFRLLAQEIGRWPPQESPSYLDGNGTARSGVLGDQYVPNARQQKRGGKTSYIGFGIDHE